MMTGEEKYNLAKFLQVYVERRLELIVKNAIEELDTQNPRDDDKVHLTMTIAMTGAQLKMITSGELDPHTAIKLMIGSKTPIGKGDIAVALDKEPI